MRFTVDFQKVGWDAPEYYKGSFNPEGDILWDKPGTYIPNYVHDKVGNFVELRANDIQDDEIGRRMAIALCIGITLE